MGENGCRVGEPVWYTWDDDPSGRKALLEGASEIFQRGRSSVEPKVDPARIKDASAIGEFDGGTPQDFLEQGLRLLPGRSARR